MVGVLGPVYDDRQLRSLIRKLPKNLKDEMSNSLFEFAQKSANSLRMETLSDPSQSPDRKKYAEQIYAEKLSKFKSVVKAPLNLVYLDSMKPHYVALKRGRKIVSWTRKYFGSQVRSGRSRVFKGPRGGIKGYLYVTPHPFIKKGLRRVRHQLTPTLRRGLRRAQNKSKR